MELADELAVFDNVKLYIYPPAEGEAINDVYAKVTHSARENGNFRCHLRFTSIPDKEKAWLEEHIEIRANGGQVAAN